MSLFFKCLLIRPTGNVNPALEDIVRLLVAFDVLESFAPFPDLMGAGGGDTALVTAGFLDLLLGATTGLDENNPDPPPLPKMLPPPNPEATGGKENEGAGLEVSNNPVGTLDVVLTIDVALKASFPPLSNPSKTVKDGNIENTLLRYPG